MVFYPKLFILLRLSRRNNSPACETPNILTVESRTSLHLLVENSILKWNVLQRPPLRRLRVVGLVDDAIAKHVGEAEFPAALVDVLEESFLAVSRRPHNLVLVFVAGVVLGLHHSRVLPRIVALASCPAKVARRVVLRVVVDVVNLHSLELLVVELPIAQLLHSSSNKPVPWSGVVSNVPLAVLVCALYLSVVLAKIDLDIPPLKGLVVRGLEKLSPAIYLRNTPLGEVQGEVESCVVDCHCLVVSVHVHYLICM